MYRNVDWLGLAWVLCRQPQLLLIHERNGPAMSLKDLSKLQSSQELPLLLESRAYSGTRLMVSGERRCGVDWALESLI